MPLHIPRPYNPLNKPSIADLCVFCQCATFEADGDGPVAEIDSEAQATSGLKKYFGSDSLLMFVV